MAGNGSRAAATVEAEAARRQAALDADADMRAAPPAGSIWHWSYWWPSETEADYLERTAEHRRYGACFAGHPRSPRNVYIGPDGRVWCRPCRTERQARRRAASG